MHIHRVINKLALGHTRRLEAAVVAAACIWSVCTTTRDTLEG